MIEVIVIGQLQKVSPAKHPEYSVCSILEHSMKGDRVVPTTTHVNFKTSKLGTLYGISFGDIVVCDAAYVFRKAKKPVYIGNKIHAIGNFFPRVWGSPYMEEVVKLKENQTREEIILDEDDYT